MGNPQYVDVSCHSLTMSPPPVSVPVRNDHDRGVSSDYYAIVLFRARTLTLGRSKSDALFSYQPPFNLLAFLILWPLSCIVSPRKLHTANVFMIKLTVRFPDDSPFDPSELITTRPIQFGRPPFILYSTITEFGNSLSPLSW